ncbi:NAD(P)-dependent dehydrogenase (short-subunit alcohol dehydrogenase family) [Bradyrhizobium sp. GM0.4]
MKLKGQCAIVTGAATGIGFAAAKRLAEEGASVVIADIKGHEAAATDLAAKGLDVVAATADVSRDDSVSGLVKSTMERCGRIDIVVNNAAMASQLKPGPFEQKTAEDWLRVYDVNVVGIFRMCRAVSPHMRAAGFGTDHKSQLRYSLQGHSGPNAVCSQQRSYHLDDPRSGQ